MQQALFLWPEEAKPLAQQWQQQLEAAVLPSESLDGWHQGMTQLQQLANQLNALDEKRGKYMTVSELKTAVFAIAQSFNRTIPVEELLRQMAVQAQGGQISPAQKQQTEARLNQLLSRYALPENRPGDKTR